MDNRLRQLARDNGGYIRRRDVLDCGNSDRDIRAALRSGLLIRLRQGVYAFAADYADLSPRERHLVHAFAVADALGPVVALSHASGAAVWAVDSYGRPVHEVELTRLDGGAGRREYGVVHHVGQADVDLDVREVDGRLVMRPVRCVIESAMATSIESGVVIASSGLHEGLFSKTELLEASGRFARWPGARHANLAMSLADGKLESVGESRSAYLFWKHGVPRPELQYDVRRDDGSLVGRADFAWPSHCHLGEFDGKVKYGRLNPYKDDPGHVVFDEKRREDEMRDGGRGMTRWTWRDLDMSRAAQTAARIKHDLDRSKKLYASNRIVMPLS